MNTYTTLQGQTWDQIAMEVFGTEYMADKIMDLNRDKLDVFVFPADVMLVLPDEGAALSQSVPSDYPAWRAMLNGKG